MVLNWVHRTLRGGGGGGGGDGRGGWEVGRRGGWGESELLRDQPDYSKEHYLLHKLE